MGMRHRGMRGVMKLGQQLVALVAIALLTVGLGSCAKPIQPTELISEPTPQPNRLTGQIAEVSPPEPLETLKQIIDAYTPQVRILSPRPGEVLNDTTATVRLQVRGLPLFKDDTWQLGPHLHLFLDDQPYQAIYDPSEPIVFEGLSPGTHTLRVFASRPWHESFKNQGAFDQRTFHVYAQTPQNEVNAKAPLLTYSRPQGSYGAEPIMLDFYLTNAPLHMSAQAETDDDLHDWRIRCTVNDQSFVFDQWQPIWLKGFKPGRNWVQLELIDEAGIPIENRFNNTVRAIDYQPGGTDTLSRLVRGELDIKDVAGIIDPTYVPPTPEPVAEPKGVESEAADSEIAPAPTLEQPTDQGATPVEPQPSNLSPLPAQPEAKPPASPTPEPPAPLAEPEPLPQPIEKTPSLDQTGGVAQPNPFLLPEKSPASDLTNPKPKDPGAEKTLIEEIQDFLEEAMTEGTPEFADKADTALEPSTQANEVEGPGVPDQPVQVAPKAALPEEVTPRPDRTAPSAPQTSAPKELPKGLIDRFKQWRDQGRDPSNPEAAPQDSMGRFAAPSPAPTTPDLFAAPGAEPLAPGAPAAEPAPEEPTRNLPRVETVKPYATEPLMTAPRLSEPDPGGESPQNLSEAETAVPESEEPVELPRIEPSRPAPRSPIAPEVRPFI